MVEWFTANTLRGFLGSAAIVGVCACTRWAWRRVRGEHLPIGKVASFVLDYLVDADIYPWKQYGEQSLSLPAAGIELYVEPCVFKCDIDHTTVLHCLNRRERRLIMKAAYALNKRLFDARVAAVVAKLEG